MSFRHLHESVKNEDQREILDDITFMQEASNIRSSREFLDPTLFKKELKIIRNLSLTL